VSEVSFAVEIDAPPEVVWAVVSDPYNLPHWERHIISVQGVPREGLGPGVEYTTLMRFLAIRASVHCRVLEWQPPSWAVILLSGTLDATVATKVDPLPGGRTLLHHAVDYHFGRHPLGELAARSLRFVGGAQLALRHGVLAQKRQIEREAR
jgi:uncharacterized membrane protein